MDAKVAPISKLCSDEKSIIYIATRLFDIEEKIKAELLEKAVKNGVNDAATRSGITSPARPYTFVPFRDTTQEEINSEDKTRILYEQDIERLDRTLLMVSFIDGLAKDEGVCFELGLAFSRSMPILLVSTDFIEHKLLSGLVAPFDPMILLSATSLIRYDRIALDSSKSFFANLTKTRREVLESVENEVSKLMRNPVRVPSVFSKNTKQENKDNTLKVFVDFGGELFEWQSMLADRLSNELDQNLQIQIERPHRYSLNNLESNIVKNINTIAFDDLQRVADSQIVIVCSDSEESPSGSSFIQGFARGLGKEIWLYNSKRSSIIGPGGYESSRNLMLDFSANRIFHKFSDLLYSLATINIK